MPPAELHVIGIDPGGVTGWAWLTIPRLSMFGDEDPQILRWDYDEVAGPENKQVEELCRIAREVQGLSYKVGPALVVEDFDLGGTESRDKEDVLSPVRIAAKLDYAVSLGKAGDSQLVMQSRSIAKQTMTDERLKRSRLYIEGHKDARDGMRHAVTALRRARNSGKFRDRLWNPDWCWT